MQVLLELRFYQPDKTDKIDRLNHALSSNMAVKMSSVVKQLLYILKLFRVTAGCIHSFRIRSKETFRIMYRKYPVLDMILRVHLCCGSFGSMIRFSIFAKKRYIRFRIKNPDLDFSKETHPNYKSTHPRKFGNDVTVHCPPVRNTGKPMFNLTLSS